MIARQHGCDSKRLKLLLDDQLSGTAATDTQRHLESCDSCRHELETLAADDSWWQEAHQFLADTEKNLGEDATEMQLLNVGVETRSNPPDDVVLDFLTPSDDPAILGQLGKYEILEFIGRGGMGIVLRGYDRDLDRYVAIKVLAPHYAACAAARKRFTREARATAAVVHQHVVAIHDVDASEKLPYLVMPYVACESLQARIDEQGPLGVKDVLRVGMQAALGLAAAHAQGLVHRDVKPANILLEKGVERVLLTDFGLARAIDDASMTQSGVIAGTPQYMSPEQTKGESIDHRADLFSLGSVLYAMCTGRPPFRAESTMGVLRRICDTKPRPVREINEDIPAWLAALVDRLLAKEPDDRYQSAGELAELLERCLAHVQHPTSVPLPTPLRKQAVRDALRRWRLPVALTLASTLVVGLAIAGSYLMLGPPASPMESADEAVTFAESQGLGTDASAEHTSAISDSPDELQWYDDFGTELKQIEQDIDWLDQGMSF